MSATTNSPPAKGEYPEGGRGFLPKLRFPEFWEAGDWEERTLEKVCRMQAGRFVAASEIKDGNPGDLFPCYGGNGLRGYTATFTHDGIFPLIGRQGALCGNVKLAKGSFYATEHALVTIPKKDVHTEWLYYLLNRLNLNQYATGQAQPGLSVDVLNAIPVAVPKSDGEQQKIADCLSSLDEMIAAQARIVEALKSHKKGLMRQILPCEGEAQPRVRFHEFKKARAWVKLAFGQAATFYNGRAYKQEELLDSGKYPVLRVGNFFTNNNWYFSDLELDETKYCDNGDLLYAWSASFGPRIWWGEKSIYHYHIWKVVEKPGIDKQFLFITLENETENMKARTTNGLGIMHITKGAIENWGATFPTMAEQRKIVDCLTRLDSAITAAIKKLDALKTHKKGLMQKLFPSFIAIK